ncbi:hypothetical protein pkur_cds_502 [Pandoravirus kuranda]|uniref:Uncharacterized protein n=1 Tax=Pandoravirus kuranda TaxID=3019033 RepID=A0AA95ECU9_9VIRU|nr:hypothetical protein pkur_cds_502 [Pandoravirus kuranda]
MSSTSNRKPYKGIAGHKVQEVLRAYKAEGIPWDNLVEPVQDALIQEFMRYYPKCRKTVCRACGCQSKKHVGRERGCLGVPNGAVLDHARIIDLCCDEAHEARQVATAVRKAVAGGSSPLVDPSVRIAYTRPHYEIGHVKRVKSAKASPPPSPQQSTVDLGRDGVAAVESAKIEGERVQAQALVQEMGQQVGAALAEVNKRTENNNQAVMAALNLLGNEVRNLRAENDAIRAQAAQALQASMQVYGTGALSTASAASTITRPSAPPAAPATGGPPTVVYINDHDDDGAAENVHKTAGRTDPGKSATSATGAAKPLARSSKNVFQLPVQNRQSQQGTRAAAIAAAAIATTSKTAQGAPPSPLYPVLSRPSTMQPRLVSLAH